MTKITRFAFGTALSIATVTPVFAQGAFESPAAPNSNESMPESANSAPVTATTLPTGTAEMMTAFSTMIIPVETNAAATIVPYATVPYATVPCATVLYSTVPYLTVQGRSATQN